MRLPVDLPSVHPGLHHTLLQVLTRLRWAIIAVLLLISALHPTVGHFGLLSWMLVVAFAAHNAAIGLLLRQRPRLRSLGYVALLDLAVTAVIYALGADPGGPLFVLFFLAVGWAVVAMSTRDVLLYTAAAAAIAASVDLTLQAGAPDGPDYRAVAARAVILALAGTAKALLAHRVALEHAAARVGRDEAERLATIDQSRADFYATISHDLRTPLTAALAACRLIELNAIDRLRADERELLEGARRNIEYLDLLIDDLLAFNQLEAGVLRLERAVIDLRAVVARARRRVDVLIGQKGQTLAVDLPAPLPAEGDPRRLEQVLVNLLGNAHRHTPAGTRIAVDSREVDGEVILTVRDDGPGIPAGHQATIFRHVASPARADGAADGPGLGLAIVKGIVDLHGGRVWVESAPEAGAAFHVALPRARSAEAP